MATNKLPQFIEIDHEGRDIRIDRIAGSCICGCGQSTAEDRRFRQGHDQRYRGILLHAYRLNYSVSVVDGGMLVTCDPQQQAVNDGVDMGKVKWVAGTIKQLNKKTAEEKPAKTEKPAPTIPDLMDALEDAVHAAKAARNRPNAQVVPFIGAFYKVKIGRWVYDARVTGEVGVKNGPSRWVVEYKTKTGELKIAELTQDKLGL